MYNNNWYRSWNYSSADGCSANDSTWFYVQESDIYSYPKFETDTRWPNARPMVICKATVMTDTDNDGISDTQDNCPNKPNGPSLGTCSSTSDKPGGNCTSDADCANGCSSNGLCIKDQRDADTDGVGDVCDCLPLDNTKFKSWSVYVDADGDGHGAGTTMTICGGATLPAGYSTSNDDGCPNDSTKTAPGICGCGVLDTDTDNDGISNCIDSCVNDPNNDADSDGRCADVDNCPNNCNVNQADADGDGIGDVCDPTPGCGGCSGIQCETQC
jgi:hypothetical protein